MNTNQQIHSFYENGVFQDFYQLLEVRENATIEEIKKNYYRLSKIYHPDFQTGNEAKMKQLGIAYQILKNPETRALYDSYYLNQKKRSRSSWSTSTKQADTSSHVPSGSSFKQTEDSTSSFSFSWNQIRSLLRKCHYQESKIEEFVIWCQENHIQISSGSELCSQFSKFESIQSKNQNKKAVDFSRKQEFSWNRENRLTPFYQQEMVLSDSMFYRQFLVQQKIRQMMYESMIHSYLQSTFLSNLQFYGFMPVRMTLSPYFPSSVLFYTRPKVKCYFY